MSFGTLSHTVRTERRESNPTADSERPRRNAQYGSTKETRPRYEMPAVLRKE
jgi:hypothetical protein